MSLGHMIQQNNRAFVHTWDSTLITWGASRQASNWTPSSDANEPIGESVLQLYVV